jgi:hypothetical protein
MPKEASTQSLSKRCSAPRPGTTPFRIAPDPKETELLGFALCPASGALEDESVFVLGRVRHMFSCIPQKKLIIIIIIIIIITPWL